VAFVPLSVLTEADNAAPAMLPAPEPPRSPPPGKGRAGAIEIALPDGARVSVDAFVDEKALSRVLRAMKGSP
jgi:transposase